LSSAVTPKVVPMSWRLRVKTSAGAKGDEHTLSFDTKEDADAALDEVMAVMGTVGNSPVKIAGKLVLIGSQVVSADVYEQQLPSYG
jgi:hypothetical protein